MCKRLMYLFSFVLVLGLTTTSAGQDIAEGLVAYWPLDEGAGTTTADASGNGNDGTFVDAPVWVSGKFGSALDFDGSNDAVDCGNPPILDFGTGDFTISCWVNVGAQDNDEAIFGKGDRGGTCYFLKIRDDGSGDIKLRLDDGSTQLDPDTDDHPGLYTAPGWHHLVAMRRTIKIHVYVDGVDDQGVAGHGDSDIPAGYDLSATSLHNAYIGAIEDTPVGRWFDGSIDDVAVWNRALTVDEIGYLWNNGIGNPIEVIPPGQASDPYPPDEQADVLRDVVFNWSPGENAQRHDVYFGTVFDDVSSASAGSPLLVSPAQDTNTFEPERLDFGQIYYWRVDEIAPDSTIYKGEVWSFTVETFGYPVAAENIIVTVSSFEEGKSPENTVNGSGLVDNVHSTVLTDMWLTAIGEPAPAWIQYDFDKAYKLHEMLVWNYNGQSFLTAAGLKDVVVEYSSDGTNWMQIDSVNEFARASGLDDYTPNTTVAFEGIPVKSVKITANSNWSGGLADQFGLSEVQFLQIPTHAKQPIPEDEATDVAVDVILGWRAGREASSHDVYISDDPNALALADSVDQPSFNTASQSLVLGRSYHWRIDEVNDAETPTTWQGEVWSFRTADFLVVDDFEDYDVGNKEIWWFWKDGLGYAAVDNRPAFPGNGTGSAVGNETSPSYMEETIVHGGSKSMPLAYNNSVASISEVTVNTSDLQIGRDWTKGAAETLVLWFYGDPANATTERMYVKLNGAEVEYPGDADDIARPKWKQWNIDLADFGISLNNVTEMSIGFKRTGTSGGTGAVFIDDIRLYQSIPEPAEEVYLEAEAAGILGASWRIYIDPASSGGQHIGSEDGDGSDDDFAPGVEWHATYSFNVTGGTYKVLLRAQDQGSDGVWVRITTATAQTHEDPDQPGTGWVRFNGIDAPSGWAWDEVHSDDHGRAIVNWTLPAGPNTIEIAKREDGVWFDAILISSID